MPTPYGKLLWSLFPPGVVWSYFAGKLDSLVEAVAENFQDPHDRVADFLKETHPSTAVETIADWEESYGLEVDDSADIAVRQQLATAKRARRQGVTPSDYLALVAPMLGTTPDMLLFIEHTSASQVARLHPRDVYRAHIYRNPELGGTYDIKKAQALLDLKTQGHVKITIIESMAFKVGDPHSIVGRDIMLGPGRVETGYQLVVTDGGEIMITDDGQEIAA